MAENKDSQDQEDEIVAQHPFNNVLARFQSMKGIQKATFVLAMILMFCVVIFILFFSGTKSEPKIIKPVAKDIIEMPKVQPEINKNVYAPKPDVKAKIIDKIEANISNLKPPAPPPPVVEPPAIKQQTTPPIGQIIDHSKVTTPQLPVVQPKINHDATESHGPKISTTSIMTFGGGKSTSDATNDGTDRKSDAKVDDKSKNKNDKFLGFDGGTIDNVTLENSSAQAIVATKINSDLLYTIAQGKVIDAVLETAINTNMSLGIVRAVVSRDVYGEHGNIVLIPKGSRLVGSYGSSSASSDSSGSAQILTRVYATWNRIITPNGVDINLPAMPATDPLGRSGIAGYVDTNLSNNLLNAFLVSVLGPYIAGEVTGISKKQTQSSSTVDPKTGQTTTTTTGTSGADILSSGLDKFQNIANDQLNKVYPAGTVTVYVDQGTRIDIIVQQDIIFPKQAITSNSANLP
jgi:type IV secretion system protein VirB10